MKKIILFAVAALMFASCGCNNTNTETEVVEEEVDTTLVDTLVVTETPVVE